MHRPVLIFAYGNPSRGDDALGPMLLQQLSSKIQHSELEHKIELQEDFQLQIEHTLDMQNRQCVVFVDASISMDKAFNFTPLSAEKDNSYSSHAMSPSALLSLFQQLNPNDSVQTYLLAIRGYDFELGHDLSDQAKNNLQQSVDYIYDWLEREIIAYS